MSEDATAAGGARQYFCHHGEWPTYPAMRDPST